MHISQYIATLDSPAKEEVGNKFYQLALINKIANVPYAICLKNNAFSVSLSQDSQDKIQDNLTMLQSNGGYRLNKIQKEIDKELENLSIDDVVKAELEFFANQISEGWKHKLIVRSSSCFEDGEDSSGAGIYESIPEISNNNELIDAIYVCWKASFSLATISHRLRINEFNINPLPGLIIQRYVTADISGVTFSQNPLGETTGIFVEYTSDGTDGIESGIGESKAFMAKPRLDGSYITNNHELSQDLEKELVDTAIKLKGKFGHETEYEWAYKYPDLYILQARPITTLSKDDSRRFPAPIANVFDLYLESDKIDKHGISEIRSIYQHSISKRKQVRLFAVENDVSINGSAVVIANRAGLRTIDLANQKELSRLNTPVLTIDLGPHLRSFYSTRSELNETLQTLIDSRKEVSIIIREFASGEFSAVSVQKDNNVLVEVCRGSLIGINRGFVETESFSVSLEDDTVSHVSGSLDSGRYYGFDETSKTFAFMDNGATDYPLQEEALVKIAHFTAAVNKGIGKNILEWTIIDNKPVYIDNTPDTENSRFNYSDGMMFISPGKINGTVLRVDDLKKLEYISSGPTLNISGHLPTLESNKEIQDLLNEVEGRDNIIIVSKFPFTALSVLVGKVSGFVFESGPILCHLAIISRENQTPIVIIPDALTRYNNGDEIEIQ